MLMYKGFEYVEVLEIGNVYMVEKMRASFSSKKTRNKCNKVVFDECVEVLEIVDEWLREHGEKAKSGERGKYDKMEISSEMSEEDLKGLYESMYSRRKYYEDLGNVEKEKWCRERICEAQEEIRRRNRKKELEKYSK